MVPTVIGEDWISLWKEYEKKETIEAKTVQHLDKFDMIVQANEYEEKYGKDLSSFFSSTKDFFYLEPFVTWDKQLRRKRSERKCNERTSQDQTT
ncbi:hypothetical protein AB6A40_002927 [Gnathostoma spinigerum]|uniref:HD domain-containing protein n=1 Tax=Gnathostoma spinigerum TaxID=75299 RepID=A0ABD6E860_9BILA